MHLPGKELPLVGPLGNDTLAVLVAPSLLLLERHRHLVVLWCGRWSRWECRVSQNMTRNSSDPLALGGRLLWCGSGLPLAPGGPSWRLKFSGWDVRRPGGRSRILLVVMYTLHVVVQVVPPWKSITWYGAVTTRVEA